MAGTKLCAVDRSGLSRPNPPSSGWGSDDDTNVNMIYGGTQSIEVTSQLVPIPNDNAPLTSTLSFKPGLDISGDFLYINGVFTGVAVPPSQMDSGDISGNFLVASTILDAAGKFSAEGLKLAVAEEDALEVVLANKANADVAEQAVFDAIGAEKTPRGSHQLLRQLHFAFQTT